jgi:hypothetical protein
MRAANPGSRTHRMAADVEPEYMSVVDAEVLTGVSRWTWRQYAYRGVVESAKVGTGRNARLLIPIAEVRRILRECTRPRVDIRNQPKVSA